MKKTAHFFDNFKGFGSDFSDEKLSRDQQKWAWHFDMKVLINAIFKENFMLNLLVSTEFLYWFIEARYCCVNFLFIIGFLDK